MPSHAVARSSYIKKVTKVPIFSIFETRFGKKGSKMLPFLKNQKEGGMSGPVEIEVRKTHDGDEDDYQMLDAIAEDMMHAFHNKDHSALKAALEALCEHIQDIDYQQDHEEFS